MISFSPIRKNWDSIAFAAIGFYIIWLFTRHSGIGISPDSVVYSSGAKNLEAGAAYLDYKHEPVVDFPVFYPLFLAAIMWMTGLNILVFAPFLNAFLFAVIIFLAGNIMEQFESRSKWIKAAVLSCIAVSPALLEDYSMLWSETIFILLVLLFVMAIHRYLQLNSKRALIAAAVIASLACITRYVGITILGAGGLLILLNSKQDVPKRIRDCISFGLLGSLFLIINLYRNYRVSETLTGYREKSITPLMTNVHDAGVTFVSWIPFLKSTNATTATVAIAIVIGLFAFCLLKISKRSFDNFEAITSLYALVYILFLIVTATFSRFETLNSRFLSPAYIFLLFVASTSLLSVFKKSAKAGRWTMATLGALLLVSFQYNQVKIDEDNWEGVKDAGIPGYTDDGWTKSNTVIFLGQNPMRLSKSYTIYSNAYDAVWWFTKRPGKFLPRTQDDSEVEDFLNDPHCYVVWFNNGENEDFVDKSFLTQTKKMKLVEEFDDGAIYQYDEPD